MTSRQINPFFLALALLLLAGLIAGWRYYATWFSGGPAGEPDGPPLSATVARPAIPNQDYAGSRACVQCHEEVAARYASHPMSRSMDLVTAHSNVEQFDGNVTLEPGGRCIYRVERSEGRLVHHELIVDQQGAVVYDQAEPLDYAVGSGVRGRSYLIDRGGILYQSPISWFSGPAKWDLSPGFRPDDVMRFDRRIVDQCLACHAGRVEDHREVIDRYESPPFAELSIGCERCHGPGGEHVRRQSSTRPPARGADDSIVNPARLDPERRNAVCYQCHLVGAARVPRYGRTEFDFRPGQRLDEVLTVLIKGTGVRDAASTKSVSQVQQMEASRCFQQSDGALSCISCHDPHGVPDAGARVVFYRERCLACHTDRGCAMPASGRLERQPDNSCVACHMVPLDAHDIAHTAQTDHRILRRPETGAGSSSLTELLVFFNDAQRRMEAWEVDRALGLAYDIEFTKSPAPYLLREIKSRLSPVIAVVPDDVPSLVALARAEMQLGNGDAARKLYEQGLAVTPDHEGLLAGLATLWYEKGQYENGLRYVDRLLDVNPWYGHPYSVKADMLRARSPAEAARAAEKGLQLNPRLPGLRPWLVRLYTDMGRPDDARRHQEILDRLNLGPHNP